MLEPRLIGARAFTFANEGEEVSAFDLFNGRVHPSELLRQAMALGLIRGLPFVDGDHSLTALAAEATASVGLRNKQLRCVTASHLYPEALRRVCRQIDGLPALNGLADIAQPVA